MVTGESTIDAWQPDAYLRFGDERRQPALDLIARIPLNRPARIFDLGCGPGSVTRLLATRWPHAHITGIDSSPRMLERARAEMPALTWLAADVQHWTLARPADLLFSNAALHWLDNHDRLFPRLLRAVRPGGCLAVQMPANFDAPSHQEAFAVARNGPWRDRLAPSIRSAPVAAPNTYRAMLAPLAASVDVWETVYDHRLRGTHPVVEWTRSTVLAPLLAALDDDEKRAFLAEYARRMATAYPPDADGVTVLPFRRLFLVAIR